MLFGLMFAFATLITALFIYFEQYLKGGIIYWSIPLYLLGFLVAILLLIILILYIITLFIRPSKEFASPRSFYTIMIRLAAEFLVGLFRIRLDVRGLEKVPKDRPFLLVSNHQSNMDPVIQVWVFRKFKIAYIMKDGIMKVPVLGRFLYGGGFLPLDRKNDRKAMETIVKASKRLAEKAYTIAVYPEGTRSKGPNMNEMRNGVFKIAQKGKAPIVIVTIDNTYRTKHYFPLRRLKVLVEVVDVLEHDTFKDLHTNELGAMVEQKMKENLSMRRATLSYLNKD